MTNRKQNIVVVELEEAIRTVLGMELEKEGYNPILFEFATEAYDYIIENQADLILSDIKLYYMDGFQFLTLLKKNNFTKHIPFIYVTGYADLRTAIESKKMGAADFVSKPYDLVDLLETIERVLNEPREDNRTSYNKSVHAVGSEGLEFFDWNTICTYFKKFISKYYDNTKVLHISKQWYMDFLFTHNNANCFGRFIRPYTFNTLEDVELEHLYGVMYACGSDKGSLYGFYIPTEEQIITAKHFNIELIDKAKTGTLLQTVLS